MLVVLREVDHLLDQLGVPVADCEEAEGDCGCLAADCFVSEQHTFQRGDDGAVVGAHGHQADAQAGSVQGGFFFTLEHFEEYFGCLRILEIALDETQCLLGTAVDVFHFCISGSIVGVHKLGFEDLE